MDSLSWFNADHSYAHHWSEHYLNNTNQFLPSKRILDLESKENVAGVLLKHRRNLSKQSLDSRSDNDSAEDSESEIDVCSGDYEMLPIGSTSWHCAEQKARSQMNECERHVVSFNKTSSTVELDKESYWEENINKTHWNEAEKNLFDKTLEILLNEKLARTAHKETSNEIVLRRLAVDRSASRLRSAFEDVEWQLKLTQWLHTVLMENLPTSLLACYLDIIQTLRSKVPTLVERMIVSSRDAGSASSERLGIMLKKPWDPAVTAVVSTAKQKPSQSILFIVVQCSASQPPLPISSRRLRFWNTLLSQLGKVIQVVAPFEENDSGDDKILRTVNQLAQNMYKTVCTKVREISSRHTNRKVVLVGWHTTSLVNCQVALREEVSAVVCMGFPMFTLFGKRGDIDDVLCDVTTPTLFVVGEYASLCDISDLEDARERTFTDAVTSSLVVGGADDWLRVSAKRKRECVVTQPMADRQILEGICDFLNTILSPPGARDEAQMSPSEINLSKKRSFPGAYKFEGKRHRSSSLQSKHSGTSAQINQLFDQKRSTDSDRDPSTLHGLSFDLQTGSVSSLTSLPGDVTEKVRSNSPVSKRERSATPVPKSKHDSKSSQSGSITIDLTKDTNEQLPAAKISSQRKSQLLQPTEKQTQAAVAAILGQDVDESVKKQPERTSPHTAVMTPSSSFSKFIPNPSTSSAVSSSPSITKSSSDLSVSYTIGKKRIGNLTAQTASSSSRSGFKPVRPGLDRFSSMDNSLVTSRTRREDRETLQATAILEQLTSSFDADPGSRPSSPEVYADGHTPRRRGGVSNRRSSDVFPQATSATRLQRTGRVRTRGGQRGNSANTSARKPFTPKPSEKTTVKASRGGGLSKPVAPRRIMLMPEFGSSLFVSTSKSQLSSATGTRRDSLPPHATIVKSGPRLERSTSVISDTMLSSHLVKKISSGTSQQNIEIAASSKSPFVTKSATKSEFIKHLVYVKEPSGKNSATTPKTRTLIATGTKAVAKLVTAKTGDRTVLSITRPVSSIISKAASPAAVKSPPQGGNPS